MADISITKLSESEIQERKIKSWPIWDKEISKFEWSYDSREECLILEGEITVETKNGDFLIKAGDFVTFEKDFSALGM